MTLAQTISKAKEDLRNQVDTDTLLLWASQSQLEIYTEDNPLFTKRNTAFASTSGTLEYSISGIASDVRKVSQVFIDRKANAGSVLVDYGFTTNPGELHLSFTQDDLKLYLEVDPLGESLTVIYYKVPNPLTATTATVALPAIWMRGLYLGIMRMASEQQYKTPSGDWVTLFENYKQKISSSAQNNNQGVHHVHSYNTLSDMGRVRGRFRR